MNSNIANERPVPSTDVHGWMPILTALNDGDFRFYGLHVSHTNGSSWFEAHYLCWDDDGVMRLPSGDNFDDWAYSDFEFWLPAPAPPVQS